MDPNAGNPFMEGANPYMQPKGQDSVAGGVMPGGPAPMGSGTSETTKPRQMPGGSDPMGGMGADTPLAPGGAGAPPPMAGGGDTNVPQPSANAKAATLDPEAYRLRVQAVRRDVMLTNPEVPTGEAHRIALAVVALQTEAVEVPDLGELRKRDQQRDSGQADHNHGQYGDLNDPNHPYWQQNGGHPFLGQGRNGVGPYGGRNRLEDHAFSRGYSGNNAEWWAVGDKALNAVVDGVRDHRDKRQQQRGEDRPSRWPRRPGQRQMPS